MALTREEIAKKLLEYSPKARIDAVKSAYDFAKEIHAGQKRVVYGDDLFAHAVATAEILLKVKGDSASIAAALLHNVLEYTKIKPEKLASLFGEEVAKIVDAVTRFKHISFEAREEDKAEHLRKVLLASTKDIRVLLLKLADKLENLHHLGNINSGKKKEMAQEALEIYAPIAHKLGIHALKNELEDTALYHLNQEMYERIVQKVAETKEERERQIHRFIDEIKGILKEKGLKAEVYGRAKSYYGIYKKLQKQIAISPSEGQIYDLIAVRVIVPATEDCYRALAIVHNTWQNLPNLFYDYIANPKSNGYQSIHTKILYAGKILEVQIRSIDMHREAEEGIAAHWLYKGTEKDKRFDKRIAWLKQILEWQSTSGNASEFIETLKIDMFKDEVVVFTPKGEPISLPEGSTPLDFAYAVHTDLGNHCGRAKANGIIIPLDELLHSGDVVEIISAKNAVPSRHWLNIVKTAFARNKIRQALHIEGEEPAKKSLGDTKSLSSHVIVENIPHAEIKFSKCCMPAVGDTIAGFKMRDGKVSVHRGDCVNITSMKAFQNISVSWKENQVKNWQVNITVIDRVGIAADILNVFSWKKMNLSFINTKPKRNGAIISLGVHAGEEKRLEQVLKQVRTISGVVDLSVVR